MSTKYLDAVTLLHSNGFPHLASAAIQHYERLASGMDAEHRCRVSAMFDDVLEAALNRREEISDEDLLLSPDFVTIRALARIIQDKGLVQTEIEMTDLDVIEGQFVQVIEQPPFAPFDDVEIVVELDEPLTNIIPQKTQPQYKMRPPVLTQGMRPSHRLP